MVDEYDGSGTTEGLRGMATGNPAYTSLSDEFVLVLRLFVDESGVISGVIGSAPNLGRRGLSTTVEFQKSPFRDPYDAILAIVADDGIRFIAERRLGLDTDCPASPNELATLLDLRRSI